MRLAEFIAWLGAAVSVAGCIGCMVAYRRGLRKLTDRLRRFNDITDDTEAQAIVEQGERPGQGWHP